MVDESHVGDATAAPAALDPWAAKVDELDRLQAFVEALYRPAAGTGGDGDRAPAPGPAPDSAWGWLLHGLFAPFGLLKRVWDHFGPHVCIGAVVGSGALLFLTSLRTRDRSAPLEAVALVAACCLAAPTAKHAFRRHARGSLPARVGAVLVSFAVGFVLASMVTAVAMVVGLFAIVLAAIQWHRRSRGRASQVS
jgi:hypothetical protein